MGKGRPRLGRKSGLVTRCIAYDQIVWVRRRAGKIARKAVIGDSAALNLRDSSTEFQSEVKLRISMLRRHICCGAFLLSITNLAVAQDPAVGTMPAYPTKPVRILVGYPGGGGLDIVARLFAQKFGDSMGQSFVVENRAGAGGNIATDLVAKAAPNGNTLIMAGSSHTINVSLFDKLPYDAVKNFAPISLVALAPSILVAHPSVPAQSLRDLIALAKSKPGQIAYSSPGSGTPQHLAMELFRSMAAIQLLHVPYNGGGPSVTAALGGAGSTQHE